MPSTTVPAGRFFAVVSGRQRTRTEPAEPCCKVADLRSIASCRVPSGGSRMIYAHCSRLRGWRLRCACCIDRSCSWCICLRSVHAQCHGLRQLLSIYTSTWLRVRGQQRPFTSPSTCSSMVTGTRGMRYNTCVVAPRQRRTVLGDPLPAMHSILCWRTHRAPLSVATLVIHMTVDVRNTAKSLPCDDVSCQNTPAFPGQPTQSPVSLYRKGPS